VRKRTIIQEIASAVRSGFKNEDSNYKNKIVCSSYVYAYAKEEKLIGWAYILDS